MHLSDYKIHLKTQLQQDNPEMIDGLYQVLKAVHPEFHASFYAQFPNWVYLYYFQPAIDVHYQMEIMLDWQEKESGWQKKLQNALMTGKAGGAARALRASLMQYASSR